jgi:hypothetical protein
VATKLTIPIPQDKIGESFVWRDWFQRLSDKVFGDLATQNANSVNITGGSITGINFGVTSIVAGTGITASNPTGEVIIANTGVTSFTSSAGLSTNTSATGAVSVTNTGVTSIIAGTGIAVSSATGAVTVSQSSTTTKAYGAYHDTSTTTATSATTAYVMSIGSIDLQSGVSIASGTRLTVTNAGIYNIQFSAQLTNPNAAIADVSIWIQLNGTNVTDSAGTNGVPAKHGSNNGLQIISWNYLLNLAAGNYIEFFWHSDTTGVQLITFPATTGPAVPQSPSLIVTITQV